MEAIANFNRINPISRFQRKQKVTRRQRFAEISFTNSAIVDDLLRDARALLNEGKTDEAQRLVTIARRILENNKKYQDAVGEILHRAD